MTTVRDRLIGDFVEERTDRLGGGTATIYSVTNDSGFVRSLERFDKQVFSADTANYKRVGHRDLAYNPSRINVGSVALCDDPDGGAVSPMYVIVRTKPGLLPEYLLALLKSDFGRQQIRHRCEGTVRSQLKFRDLCAIPISLPSIAEQERLLRTFAAADHLMDQRDAADGRMARLAPALFVEMFGEPSMNAFGWPIENVGTLFDDDRGGTKCGPFGSALKKHEYRSHGVPVWGIPNVLANEFEERGSLFISEEKYKTLEAYNVKNGDLLISRAGSVGRICVARPTTEHSIIGTNLIRLSLDRSAVLPEFFSTLLTYFARELGGLRANRDEKAYSFMNTSSLKALRIYVPPIGLQERFVERLSEVQRLEAGQATSRSRLEDLVRSIRNGAFSGELSVSG